MHDPLAVAFEIRRPWPRREKHAATGRRWDIAWGPFWTLAGRRYYWPTLITVWHREPGGHDSGEVCTHHSRVQKPDGTWCYRFHRAWRFHVHHWKVQIRPLQDLRRWALTRCAWCGGPSRKRDRVNISHQWDGPRGRWWQGEPGLFHRDCSSVEGAHRKCLCEHPLLSSEGFGQCAFCGRFRAWGSVPDDADRMLAALPKGSRIPADMTPDLETAWAARRERQRQETPDE